MIRAIRQWLCPRVRGDHSWAPHGDPAHLGRRPAHLEGGPIMYCRSCGLEARRDEELLRRDDPLNLDRRLADQFPTIIVSVAEDASDGEVERLVAAAGEIERLHRRTAAEAGDQGEGRP